MKKITVTFTVDDDLAKAFRKRVPRGKRGAFLAEAIRARFTQIDEEAQVRELMKNLADQAKVEVPLELDTEADSLAILADMDDIDTDL